VQCASDEDHASLNYADFVQGTSALGLWVILPDGSMLETDVSAALVGSGTWLALPDTGRKDAPIRLLMRRPLDASSSRFRFASVSLDVLFSRSVDIEVYDTRAQVAAQHSVRPEPFT